MKLQGVEAMRRAIAEAARGAGFVSPNPLVGCVITDRDHELLAVGHHARVGDLHAETHALAQIEDRARLKGAHVYVTLEPCAHQGRQPSCAKTLAALPIASVTYGLDDPNPLVMGKGVEILRAAGIAVARETALEDELEETAEIFLLNQRRRRPFVAVKVAASLDGKVALSNGESKWITGAEARARVHHQRGCYDAVLTGAGTIIRDDPRLDARASGFEARPNRLVVLDPRGSLVDGFEARTLSTVRRAEDVLFVTAPGGRTPRGVTGVEVGVDARGTFALEEMLEKLRSHDVHSVYVEAGPITVSSFLAAGLVDRLFVYLAPKIIGRGSSWSETFVIPGLDRALRLEGLTFQPVGRDWMATAKVQS